MTDRPKFDDAEFAAAFKKLPIPIPFYGEGAICPWCGELHETITFGENNCLYCKRCFVFGIPPWDPKNRTYSYVNFPLKEFEALGRKSKFFQDWKPNATLEKIYFIMSEENLGKFADESPVQ